MNELTLYNNARNALAQASSVDEVKEVKDKAEALRLYAQQQNNTELEEYASKIKTRAMRRIGELAGELEKSIPTNGRGSEIPAGGKTKGEALSDAGISSSQAYRCEELAKIPEEKFEAALEVGMTATEILREEKKSINAGMPKPELPTDQYSVIVIDPPWPMEKIERDVRPNQVAFDYPTMTEQEIFDFNISDISAPDCHMFMWTTHKFLPLAFKVLEAWNFRYVFCMTWHKPGGFQPIGLAQYNSEFCLYARQGYPKFVDTKAFPTCFQAPRGAHSEKPEEFYDIVRRVTEGKRLDVFNRRKIEGFTGWGNESGL